MVSIVYIYLNNRFVYAGTRRAIVSSPSIFFSPAFGMAISHLKSIKPMMAMHIYCDNRTSTGHKSFVNGIKWLSLRFSLQSFERMIVSYARP